MDPFPLKKYKDYTVNWMDMHVLVNEAKSNQRSNTGTLTTHCIPNHFPIEGATEMARESYVLTVWRHCYGYNAPMIVMYFIYSLQYTYM